MVTKPDAPRFEQVGGCSLAKNQMVTKRLGASHSADLSCSLAKNQMVTKHSMQ